MLGFLSVVPACTSAGFLYLYYVVRFVNFLTFINAFSNDSLGLYNRSMPTSSDMFIVNVSVKPVCNRSNNFASHSLITTNNCYALNISFVCVSSFNFFAFLIATLLLCKLLG